jgi:hypothetical protein
MSSISKIQDLPEISPTLSTPAAAPGKDPISFIDTPLKLFSEKLKQDKEEGYIVPKRRVCGTSNLDSQEKVALASSTVFISEQEIIGAPRAMKFLPSPFPTDEIMTSEEEARLARFIAEHPHYKTLIENDKLNVLKREQAVAITKEGKYVILQQGTASCIPSSVAMLILDRGGKPEYDTIRDIHFATKKDAIAWLQTAGFSTKITKLLGTSTNKLQTLSTCLKEYGPGALEVFEDNGIGGHEIVLDGISLERRTATIRDPFHGWQIDIQLSALARINLNNFIQITGKK